MWRYLARWRAASPRGAGLASRLGLSFAGGAATGALATFFADPDRGRRRRALARDKANHLAHETAFAARVTARDARQRISGKATAARLWIARRFSAEPVADDVLVARVRSQVTGRAVTHPAAIDVEARHGTVVMSGEILTAEKKRLLAAVRRVPGVRSVEDRLRSHDRPGTVPALQEGGTVPRLRRTRRLTREFWTPAQRLAGIATGGAIALWGLRRPGAGAKAGATAGLLLFGRGATNLDLRRLLGIGGGRRGIRIQKTMHIAARPEVVFDFWDRFENFPGFMEHVSKVEDLGGLRSRWTVRGPAGVPLSWDALITRREPNRLLAWKSAQGSAIRHAGIVRFEPASDGGTYLDVKLSYNPPFGAIGHAVASLFRRDPKHELDEDLLRMKSLIEQCKTTAHGETVTRDEVLPPSVRPSGT